MSHTPGPWEWEFDEHGPSHLRAANGTTILNLEEDYEMCPGTEDAKLIESSPDLLSNCEELLRKIDALGYSKSDNMQVKELLDLIDYYLDTPIKKARGE